MYDAVVAGGSIAGLLCAREIASGGHSVLVLEEDHEIGTPDHCGGLVSTGALEELGIVPGARTYNHKIESARVCSPSGKEFEVDSSRQNIIELSRRELDLQAARQAQKAGAKITVGTRCQKISEDFVTAGSSEIGCKVTVDARGVSSLIYRDRTGVIPSAQYEIYADWIKSGQVEVIFDSKKYPGFFAWVIPSSAGCGKVGVAGRGISAARALDELLESRGKFSAIRRIFAPIWIGGPVSEFVEKNTVIIGDAAGQAKPTTAGGIFSCGMGGILAGRAISEYLKTGDRKNLQKYQTDWTERFGREFEQQLRARKILERLDNRAIDGLFDSVTPEIAAEISKSDDFDFHASSIIRLLGARASLRTAQTVLGAEIRRLIGGAGHSRKV